MVLRLLLLHRWGGDLPGSGTALIATLGLAFDPHSAVWGVYAQPHCIVPLLVLVYQTLVRLTQRPWDS